MLCLLSWSSPGFLFRGLRIGSWHDFSALGHHLTAAWPSPLECHLLGSNLAFQNISAFGILNLVFYLVFYIVYLLFDLIESSCCDFFFFFSHLLLSLGSYLSMIHGSLSLSLWTPGLFGHRGDLQVGLVEQLDFFLASRSLETFM